MKFNPSDVIKKTRLIGLWCSVILAIISTCKLFICLFRTGFSTGDIIWICVWYIVAFVYFVDAIIKIRKNKLP